ncbi:MULTISPECIES: GntR family transcriptional regulator [unclassified Cryobacterium]|uniref:GntR family transcriptional regulator n=1 Tax=unclassified Cryobacterium TaxID=2649013 RepID=UPI002B226D1C|nr:MULTISPECIES: GntR family transcriptional regulator [unclassified Cryobacterium]MEB0001087.1 GntR family transcriptional regulator [Cryobacterium sp. RTS3]MEB0267593.1 GntR family transcriptional regulator [Cryobacterium sp. 10I5]
MSIYTELHRMVVSGDLDSRKRTTESELATRLGTSRTPVREALQRLEGDGLVLAEGRGVRVRTMPIDELVDLFTARAGLEGWAVFQAATRVQAGAVPPAHLAELDALADLTDACTRAGDLERAAEANRTFHERTAGLSENCAVIATLSQWWDRTVVSTRHTIRTPQRVDEVDHEHRLILNALRQGDANMARDAAQSHILATRDALITINEGNQP